MSPYDGRVSHGEPETGIQDIYVRQHVDPKWLAARRVHHDVHSLAATKNADEPPFAQDRSEAEFWDHSPARWVMVSLAVACVILGVLGLVVGVLAPFMVP